jgi:hypothetical protein
MSGTVNIVDKNNQVISGVFHKQTPISPIRIVLGTQSMWLGDIISDIKHIIFNYNNKVVNVNLYNNITNVLVIKDKSDINGLDNDIIEDIYRLCNQSGDTKVAKWIEKSYHNR